MASRQSAVRLFAALSIALTATAGFGQWSISLNATSGTGTVVGNYRVSTDGILFTNVFKAEILVVAGGGSGGTPGAVGSNQDNWGTGGGGGGGVITPGFYVPLSTINYAVTVGGGGAAPAYVSGSTSRGNNGANSAFDTYTTLGGGGGGGGKNAYNGVGADGGSGGGGGGKYDAAGGVGKQGNSGGNARAGNQSSAGGRTAGGGGGGSGGYAGDAVSTVAGNGGAGVVSTITGSSVRYGGGGGGGAGDIHTTPTAGLGGSGGGGNGGANTAAAGNGTDGLGGGGGGRGADGVGGQGGSGIVIVRYAGAPLGNIGGTVTSGSGSAAGYTLHTFTTTGTTTTTSALNLSNVDMNARLGVKLTGLLSGDGGVTFAGPGRLTLAVTGSFTGDTRISSGTLEIGNANALQNSTLDMNAADSGAVAFTTTTFLGGLKGSRAIDNGGNILAIGRNNQSTTYSGGLSGAGGLSKIGTGTLTLSGSSSFTGDTSLVRGTLAVANANALAGSTLSLGGDGAQGSITFSQASNIGGLSGGDVVLDNGGYTLTVGGNNQSTTYSGGISGAGGLTKQGTGALTLTGSSSFTGDTTVSSGTLVLGSGNALSSRAAVTVASGATLQATTQIRIGYLDSQGTVVGGGNLTATATVTQSGNIGGIANGTDSQGTFAAGIVKLGAGTSTVNAANTYTGLTWVREGTLAVGLADAFAAASDLTVDSGATLDRAGFSQTVTDAVINGTVVGNTGDGDLLTVNGRLSGTGVVNGDVLVNGVHAPGNSPGIQTFNGNLSYGSSATINWELTGNTDSNSPVVFDQIVLTGLADLVFGGSNLLSLSFNGAGSLVNWNDSFWDVDQAWTVFDLASGVTTGFSNLSLGGSLLDANGLALDGATRGSFSLFQSGQDVSLRFTAVAVPEPSTTAMALAGLACGGFSMWRRRLKAKVA